MARSSIQISSFRLNEHTTAGRCRLECLDDVDGFVARVENDRTPDRYQKWVVVIGSTSPSKRRAMLAGLEELGYQATKYSRSDRQQLPRDFAFALPRWKQFAGAVISLPMALLVAGLNTAGRAVGRGARMYLLDAPVLPPSSPPNAGVREPRNPMPPLDSLSIQADLPD